MGKMFNQKNHHRKSIRLREYDYTNPNWYYITICSYKRENIFGKVEKNKMILNKEGEIVEQEWLKIKELRKRVGTRRALSLQKKEDLVNRLLVLYQQ
jgi:putative transposase